MAKPEKTPGVALELFDPGSGGQAFQLQDLRSTRPGTARRVNYFTVFWIRSGAGVFHADSSAHPFTGPALLFANPYQILSLASARPLEGARLSFHANFFCIETYHEEVGCNGVLFNDIYGAPVLSLSPDRVAEFEDLIAAMREEAGASDLASSEILLSYLKVFLIKATRLKLQQQPCEPLENQPQPEILNRVLELIEIHFREKRRPSEYAALLGISPKALNKIVKAHFGKNLTLLIRERILKHAKWHLLHTRKPVKEVAAETGFADELYFSRLFRRATGMAPTTYRDFETRIRGGRNLPS